MAKDGTHRGGRRVRSGAKPQPLVEKINAGKNATRMNQVVTANARTAQDDYARSFAELENQYQQQTHRIEQLETQIEEKNRRAIQIRSVHQYQCEHPSIEYSDDA